MAIAVKRIYEDPAPDDGTRVLVDRIWPRGVSKEDARLDRWLREVAPSDDLRRWFDHRADRWEAFKARYFEELEEAGEAVSWLREAAREGSVTLLFGARDQEHNQAVALKEYLGGDAA